MRDILRLVLAAAVLALLGTTLVATPAQAATDYQQIKIQNVSNRLCLAPAGSGRANNATIVQYTCKALGLTTFGTSYNDTYHAYEIESDQSLECLSPAGGSIGLNVAIVQYTCDGDPSRYWKIVPTSGVWTLQNLKSKLCLSPAGGSVGLNTVMVQYTCDGNQARNWEVFTALAFQNSDGGNCATIAGASTAPNVVQYYCDGQPPRLWSLTAGTSHIFSPNTGLCLAPADGGTGINVALVISYCYDDPPREWIILPS